MTTISIKNLSFAYPGQTPLFDHCQLNLDSSWKLGLLGRNGRGKTTFFNILRGRLNYQGQVDLPLTPVYFPLNIDNEADFSINALLDAVGNQVEQWQIERELNLLDVDPALLWQPFSSLSGGEQTKLQLATLFALDNDFLLLDEPTNHLDLEGRQQLASYIQGKQQGLIITSHDQDFLDQVIDHTLVIEKHQLLLSQGNYSNYFAQKERRDQTAVANNEKLVHQIKHLQNSRQQKLQWAQRAEGEKKHNSHADKGFIGAKAARMMKKTLAVDKKMASAIKERQGLLQEVEQIVPLTINQQANHHNVRLSLNQVSLAINGQALFQPVTFEVKAQQQVALVGPNGAGKSSLFKAILGSFSGETQGTITIADGVNISLVRQDYQDHHGSLEAFADRSHIAYEDLLNLLRKLGMDRQTFTVPIEDMSLGQQKKVELARSLATPASLYLWDEPLNYLDTYNQAQLIQLIQEQRPPMLFIEHDQHFIDQVATKVVPIRSVK